MIISLCFQKNRDDHVVHLHKIFDRCRSLVTSLNLKKSVLGFFKGSFWGILSQRRA
jgi:hypothetical protein